MQDDAAGGPVRNLTARMTRALGGRSLPMRGDGERLDMRCGRFRLAPAQERVIRSDLLPRPVQLSGGKSMSVSLMRLKVLVKMMRAMARLISTSCWSL